LNLKSSQSVGIVVLYLQEVDELGRPHHLSEGVLNLEFARDETPAVKVPGVPFRSYSAASREVFATEKMTEVSLDLSPLSSRIRKGHRIRLSVHGADADNYFADPHSDGATLSIALSGERPTTLTIPVLSSAEPAEGFIDAFRDLPESNSYATRIA
jgi:predicted acyl esterase